ncbi:hypothetical protein GCM10023100_02790 [Actinocorallia cavernae]|uniref:Uncharacterized protein n=1 Tax=Actinocorallia cavernae TaxID=328075 RepID=A0ABP8S6V7_9ACTN
MSYAAARRSGRVRRRAGGAQFPGQWAYGGGEPLLEGQPAAPREGGRYAEPGPELPPGRRVEGLQLHAGAVGRLQGRETARARLRFRRRGRAVRFAGRRGGEVLADRQQRPLRDRGPHLAQVQPAGPPDPGGGGSLGGEDPGHHRGVVDGERGRAAGGPAVDVHEPAGGLYGTLVRQFPADRTGPVECGAHLRHTRCGVPEQPVGDGGGDHRTYDGTRTHPPSPPGRRPCTE